VPQRTPGIPRARAGQLLGCPSFFRQSQRVQAPSSAILGAREHFRNMGNVNERSCGIARLHTMVYRMATDPCEWALNSNAQGRKRAQ
jgi:hypothetical protein